MFWNHDAVTTWREPMAAMAREHLPEEVAATWTSLLRPAAQLYPAGAGDTVVGQLGGVPHLPEDAEWPWWDDYGPLAFVASVDCAHLPALDIALPDAGTLLFFYWDGQVDEGETTVGTWEPETQEGARVVYVPPGTPTTEATTPEDLEPYPVVPLAARLVGSEPGYDHPATQRAFLTPDDDSLAFHPIADDDFVAALHEVRGFRHQIGGHATPIQSAVEHEITAMMTDDEDPRAADPDNWLLLAQIQSDGTANMMWGDLGTLYWLIRPDDLAARRFDAAAFTWQCS
jgi:uncharacterized protein YwqG